MNCRGVKTRIEIVTKYTVNSIAHLRLLKGQSKRSDAEANLTDRYYIFECALKADNNIVKNIICGVGAANHFFNLTNEERPPLFDPLKSESTANGNGGCSSGVIDFGKWNEESKQLYTAIQWLIICWDIVPRGAIIDIKNKLEKYYYKEPFVSQIKAVNTIISKSSSRKTLTQMIDELRANNDIKDFDFLLLKGKLQSENIKSYF